MTLGSRRKTSRLAKAIMVAMALMTIPLAVEYGRQSVLRQHWLHTEETVIAERATAQALKDDLLSQKAYVQTSAYVEAAARSRLRMSRPGEVLVVLVATPTPAPTLEPTATTAPETKGWLERLLP